MDNQHRGQGTYSRPLTIVIAALVVILGVLCFFLVRAYSALRREHIINFREFSLSTFVAEHGPLGPAEVGMIRPWMTFDYVNRTFGLPVDFLKTTFGITDPNYPKLTLSWYATEKGFNQAQFVSAVQIAVAEHLNTPH